MTELNPVQKIRLAVASIVTLFLIVAFIFSGAVALIAAAQWTFGVIGVDALLRGVGAWVATLLLLNLWSWSVRVQNRANT